MVYKSATTALSPGLTHTTNGYLEKVVRFSAMRQVPRGDCDSVRVHNDTGRTPISCIDARFGDLATSSHCDWLDTGRYDSRLKCRRLVILAFLRLVTNARVIRSSSADVRCVASGRGVAWLRNRMAFQSQQVVIRKRREARLSLGVFTPI